MDRTYAICKLNIAIFYTWINLHILQALGKLCKVVKVYSDGDLRLEQLDDGFEWTLNPKCVKLERSPIATAAERSNSMMDLSNRRTDHVMTPLSGLSGTSMADKLVRESAQGHYEFVKKYLETHPDHVNAMSGGKASIQVAAHQGFVDIVQLLISKGANVNVVDKEGDSALHYAAFGNQPETMRILLVNGADKNFLNSSHCTALHICAHKKTPHCVRELLNHNVDVNIQDSYGDTALHDAIGKENSEVVDILCSAPNLDFTVKNNRGFNVLHHAALKGNVAATRRILQLARQLVNVKKDDGFAAMHLAALNGHAQVVEALVREGQADIDITNNRRQTPFLLAVSQGHISVIEKLVKLGCDVTARDEDGDNAMHLCVVKKNNILQASEPTLEDCPEIFSIFESLAHVNEDRLMFALLCYLSQSGCQIEYNNKGVNIFEWITDIKRRQLILGNQRVEPLLPPQTSNSPPSDSINTPTIDQLTHNIQMMNLETNVQEGAAANNLLQSSKSSACNIVLHDETSVPDKQSVQNISSNNVVFESERLANVFAPSTPEKNSSIISPVVAQACIVCDEVLPLIKFEPCQHQISCEDCGKRMKKCLRCGVHIEKRIDTNGRNMPNTDASTVPAVERLRYLENKILEYEESHYCSICMERSRDVAFLCGHGSCARCAETLRTCHMCRKTILKKINLY